METVLQMLVGVVQSMVGKFPVLVGILSFVGTLRLINKPLFSAVRSITSATPSKKDDLLVDQVEASKGYKLLCFILDLFTSVKLPERK